MSATSRQATLPPGPERSALPAIHDMEAWVQRWADAKVSPLEAYLDLAALMLAKVTAAGHPGAALYIQGRAQDLLATEIVAMREAQRRLAIQGVN